MIKLKQLILESQIVNQAAFQIPGDETWEYKIDNNIYYTRKQGSEEWLDMKQSLSNSNYTAAVNIIDTHLNSKNQSSNAKTPDAAVNKQQKKPDMQSIDEKTRLLQIFKSQKLIMSALKEMLTDRPQDSFRQFKSKVNDKELELYYFWYKNSYLFYKKRVTELRNKSYDAILKSNCDLIEESLDIISQEFKEGGSDWSFQTTLQNPVNKKTITYAIKWNYLKW